MIKIVFKITKANDKYVNIERYQIHLSLAMIIIVYKTIKTKKVNMYIKGKILY